VLRGLVSEVQEKSQRVRGTSDVGVDEILEPGRPVDVQCVFLLICNFNWVYF
jgi:hypothetical protein